MSKPTTIKMGKFTYYLETDSGFWRSMHETDPHSSTVTQNELIAMMEDYVKAGDRLIVQVKERQGYMQDNIEALRN